MHLETNSQDLPTELTGLADTVLVAGLLDHSSEEQKSVSEHFFSQQLPLLVHFLSPKKLSGFLPTEETFKPVGRAEVLRPLKLESKKHLSISIPPFTCSFSFPCFPQLNYPAFKCTTVSPPYPSLPYQLPSHFGECGLRITKVTPRRNMTLPTRPRNVPEEIPKGCQILSHRVWH